MSSLDQSAVASRWGHSSGAMGKAFCKIDETVGGTNIALLGFESWFYVLGVHPWANY